LSGRSTSWWRCSSEPRSHPPEVAERIEEERRRLQADLATLSRRGRQIVAARSGHHIQLEDPRLVVRAVRDVVEEARARAVRRPAP
jgi:hypothetical protein